MPKGGKGFSVDKFRLKFPSLRSEAAKAEPHLDLFPSLQLLVPELLQPPQLLLTPHQIWSGKRRFKSGWGSALVTVSWSRSDVRPTLSHQHELVFMPGWFQLRLQLLFGLLDVSVHLLPLLLLHLVQSFPAGRVLELEGAGLGEARRLLSLPEREASKCSLLL